MIGPFTLGDWFKKHRKEQRAKGTIVIGAPDDAEIVKSFNDCKLYVIDQRVWKDKDTVRFDGSPKLVAEGRLGHAWEGKGKSCKIWLKSVGANVTDTDHTTSPPFRTVLLQVTFDICGENSGRTESGTYSLSSLFSYDIIGKEIPLKQ